jgi:hypothetical protein
MPERADSGPGPGNSPGPSGGTGPGPAVGEPGPPGAELSDLPEAALRRLESSGFSSGLSVPDFAACLDLGLEPVALVQGFCVMRWGWYGPGSGYGRGFSPYAGGAQTPGAYSEVYRCPHGYVSAEHRTWGQNLEQPWVEEAWSGGYTTAYSRMLEEAQTHGAHGIVGVVDRVTNVADRGTTEFHFLGTAVNVEGGPPPVSGVPWSTYLAGQRLIKSIEAGFMPVAVVAALASVRVWAYCMTEYLMEGSTSWGPGRPQLVEQVSKAHMAVRQLARKHVRQQLSGDQLHGARIEVVDRELSQGDEVIDCTLRGNRVRRFKDFDEVPLPIPTVRLG